MPWKRRRSYPYNRAEWWGVVLALVGTPALIDQVLGWLRVLPVSASLAFTVLVGGVAASGWTLLALGTRAHRRAERTSAV